MIQLTLVMLDIRFIRENPEKVQENAQRKGYTVDIAGLLKLDEDRRELGRVVDELRERRNANAAKMIVSNVSRWCIIDRPIRAYALAVHFDQV